VGFQINTNIPSQIAQDNLRLTADFQQKTISRVTSGLRITSSGDDNVNIQNNTNTSPAVSTSTITINGGSANTGVLGSGYLFGIRGTMNTTIDILNVTSNNNFSGGVVGDSYDTAVMDIEVSGSTLTNNNDGISISSNNGNSKFNIHNNLSFAGNDFGVAIAALVMLGGFELFREFEQYRMLLFGLAMVLIMIWKPRGLISTRSPSVFLKERKAISSDLVGEGRG
jgi:hypothetical protein